MGKTALQIMKKRYGGRPGFKKALARERALSDQDPSIQLARLFKAIRKKVGFSQEELAEVLGVTQPRISQIESENLEGYQMETYIRLMNAMGCTFRVHVDLPQKFANDHTGSSYDLAFPPRKENRTYG